MTESPTDPAAELSPCGAAMLQMLTGRPDEWYWDVYGLWHAHLRIDLSTAASPPEVLELYVRGRRSFALTANDARAILPVYRELVAAKQRADRDDVGVLAALLGVTASDPTPVECGK